MTIVSDEFLILLNHFLYVSSPNDAYGKAD